ncbi:MAG: metallophosphoesterase [Deltaproteobacteria bacterium]|nr:metallophosphoesterase [Deltaproteobacteria bacterium]MBW2117281.1 metallophosphoesterase [Deltaproteobacteria bacterium]
MDASYSPSSKITSKRDSVARQIIMKGLNLANNMVKIIAHSARQYPIKSFCLTLCILIVLFVDVWEPFSSLPARDWNIKNLNEIRVADPDGFSFSVFGENRYSKFIFENLLKIIDHDPDIVFAISLGDMVSRGRKYKYANFLKQVRDNLSIPLITTMGNRELLGRGRALYHDIFGPSYYSFHIGKNYFMVLDDAGNEDFDLMQKDGWLETELQNSQQYNTRIVFMHTPLYDPKGENHQHCLTDKSAKTPANLFLKYHVTHIFASRIHGYFNGRWKGIPYTITGGAGAKLHGTDPDHYFFHFLKVNINKGNVDIEVKQVPRPDYFWLDRLLYNFKQILSFSSIHLIEIIFSIIPVGLATLIYRSESRKKILGPKV